MVLGLFGKYHGNIQKMNQRLGYNGYNGCLVGGLVAIFYVPIYWVAVIIPNDELIFFRGVALAHQPDLSDLNPPDALFEGHSLEDRPWGTVIPGDPR